MGLLKMFTYIGLFPCLRPCLDVFSSLCWIGPIMTGLVIILIEDLKNAFKDVEKYVNIYNY